MKRSTIFILYLTNDKFMLLTLTGILNRIYVQVTNFLGVVLPAIFLRCTLPQNRGS